MLNVITLFSGYDSQCLALRRLGIDFNLVAWSEIDKTAIKAHDVLFPEFAGRNFGDVTKADWSQIHEPIDLLTYSSPCQDFSVAGLQRGGEAGSGTRSSLLWEVERAIDALHPRYLLLENVAALVGTKFMPLFERWCRLLESKGYHNTWQILNAKHYGVPQNRRRVFLVSKYHDETPYYFPQPFKLEKHLRDVLEDNVDERYYLSEEKTKNVIISAFNQVATCAMRGRNKNKHSDKYEQHLEVGSELTANAITTVAKDSMVIEQQVLGWTRSGGGEVSRHPVEVANCVTVAKRDNTQNYVVEKCILANTEGFGTPHQSKEVSPTIKASECECVRIRRLTPRECLRLMDVEDCDIDRLIDAGIANTQLTKLAGNSIVVGVLCHIFRTLLGNGAIT